MKLGRFFRYLFYLPSEYYNCLLHSNKHSEISVCHKDIKAHRVQKKQSLLSIVAYRPLSDTQS